MRNMERGQAILLVVVACGLCLIGALGLAVDGAQIYGHRQLAQLAADSAAQAGAMSIFDNTWKNPAALNPCAASATSPCKYANFNGFGGSEVAVDFPAKGSYPGVNFSSDANNPVRVTITRTVNTTLVRFFGATASTVKAIGVAGIVVEVSPIPILILHPTLTNSFSLSGNQTITICGGPKRSIQVNSCAGSGIAGCDAGTAASGLSNGSTVVDLSQGGPPPAGPLIAGVGSCAGMNGVGTGSDFGAFGQPSAKPAHLNLGTRPGIYIQPSSPITDPLANVSPPAKPINSGNMGTKTPLAFGVAGCPPAALKLKACQLYHPGLWNTIDVQNETAVFSPGVYYVDGGIFRQHANANMYMCTDTGTAGLCPASAATGDVGVAPPNGTGIMVYLAKDNAGHIGTIDVGANSAANLLGSTINSTYEGILFFGDHTATNSQSFTFGGGGGLTLQGTIYLTTHPTSDASPSQSISFGGGAGSETLIKGEVITDVLGMTGNSGITMQLDPNYKLPTRQVALIQ